MERNVHAVVLELLRQSGYASATMPAQCNACCAAEKAAAALERQASLDARGDIYRYVLQAVERPLICSTLARTGGNQLAAARLLGINRNTLRARMKALNIRADRV